MMYSLRYCTNGVRGKLNETLKMTSRFSASFHKYIRMGKFHISTGNLINSVNSARLLRCFSPQMESALHMACVRHIHSSYCLEAGHSKWKNIKHVKEASDRERGLKSNLLSRKIQIVLDRNPEPDPRLNSELASLIKWARANNLTNELINNCIDRQKKLRDPKYISSFGARGPSNTGIMIECFSLKPNHTKGILQNIVKKFGFSLNSSADDLFDYKGIVDVGLSNEELAIAQTNRDNFPLDKFVDIAINCGAEDVSLVTDDEEPYLQFLCAPLELPKVSKAMADMNLNIINSEKTYLPKITVPVTQEFMENVNKLADKLDLNNDVVKFYFNVEPES